MIVLGLTGGIGMGKSTAAEFLRRLGWEVIDTDVLAREVVAPGQPARIELVDAFGPEILDSVGALRRERLADLVFSDPSRRRRLEEIVHPRIRECWMQRLAQAREEGAARVLVVIPLLFEANAQSAFDKIVCMACQRSTQHQRLRARHWSDEQIRQRLAAQWPIERKMLAADIVIWTEGHVDLQDEQLRRAQISIGRP